MNNPTTQTVPNDIPPANGPAAQVAPPTPAALVPAKPAKPRETVAADAEPSRALSAFSGTVAFETAQRMAKALAESTLVPKEYQGNVSNCLIAMEVANRVGASVLMVMQSLDIIYGRPSWRAAFLTATVNASGRFTPIRYRFQGTEGHDDWGCRAVAKDKSDGEPCIGTLITIAMAKAEGWYDRNGTKWRTMPEQMLRYRAVSFWTRTYAPELSLGMQTSDEVYDTTGEEIPSQILPGNARDLEAALSGTPAAPTVTTPATPPHDPQTGEVLEAKKPAPEPQPTTAPATAQATPPAGPPGQQQPLVPDLEQPKGKARRTREPGDE